MFPGIKDLRALCGKESPCVLCRGELHMQGSHVMHGQGSHVMRGQGSDLLCEQGSHVLCGQGCPVFAVKGQGFKLCATG